MRSHADKSSLRYPLAAGTPACKRHAAQKALHFPAARDYVHKAVLEYKFRRLEFIRQDAALMVSSITRRPAKPTSTFGSAMIISPSEQNLRSRRLSWVGQHGDVKKPRVAVASHGARCFGHLHQRNDAFLHPRAA